MDISIVSDASQLPRLLPLMRSYCDFYNVAPDDAALLAMSRALMADPDREGVQFLATNDGEDVGFATVFWSWETSIAARVGVLNDLFVVPQERGRGVATALMGACRQRCREQGAVRMIWQTAPDNHRAQSLYERLGANRESWIDYWLSTAG
ncbi:MAG TPA: GNAT family N-acetyltransferase [Candidatus Dormibacteraeota bacterium]|jgi:GNAT superfamily N-acetyltransferase